MTATLCDTAIDNEMAKQRGCLAAGPTKLA